MGNNHSDHHPPIFGRKASAPEVSTLQSASLKKTSISRTASGSDIQDRNQITNIASLQKLGKILTQKAVAEEGVSGITQHVFSKYLFPRYPLLAEKLFKYFHIMSHAKTKHLGSTAFLQQCDRYLQILDDGTIADLMVKLFSTNNNGSNNDTISVESMKNLLMSAYQISMDHYSEGPQMCFYLSKTLKAVVDSCFHLKDLLSISFVSHWLQTNCPRLLMSIHRYIVHCLTTSYRTLQETNEVALAAGLELATPVLDKPPPFAPGKPPHPRLLSMSMSWLLASALPPLYSQPQVTSSPGTTPMNSLSPIAFMAKLVCSIPSHWVLLYDSDEMGLGANRFLHHVLNYKGPNLILIKTEGNYLFCIASADEWKESHQYKGGESSCLFQIYPKFGLLEKGPKMLYLNMSARGYPHGLRAGSDPRAPIISVDGTFEKIQYNKIPYDLHTIEVWGCGDPVSRDHQIDIKKWEVKEAERQRVVKISADDWLENPDRYLLELGGRPQYNNQH